MSDNNLNNQQPNYENYNQYQQPVQPIYVAAPGVVNSAEDERKAKNLGIWGLILGILSPCGCFFPALIGLGLSIGSVAKNKKSVIGIIALIINALIVAYLIYSFIYSATHPEQYQQTLEQLQQMMEQASQQAGFIL